MKGYIDTKGHDKSPCESCKYKTRLTVESPCYNCISSLDLALHKANAETEFTSYEPQEESEEE